MSEDGPGQSHESSEEVYDRKQIVDLFRVLLERYRHSSDPLPDEAPDVIRAYELRETWNRQRRNEAAQVGTPEAEISAEFDILTVLVDAGYNDPLYVTDHVLSELIRLEERARGTSDELLVRKIGNRIEQLQFDED